MQKDMTGFDSRREAFENKFAHDEALRFKVVARRNKLLGLWAASQPGPARAGKRVRYQPSAKSTAALAWISVGLPVVQPNGRGASANPR